MKRWFTYVCILGVMGISGLACQKQPAAPQSAPPEPTNVEETTTGTTTTAPAPAPTEAQ